MGLLDSVEKGIEKVVRGAFTAGSRGQVQPVEIASRLRRELDNESYVIAQGRTLAPNVFDVELSTPDFERAQNWGEGLADELCDVVIKHVNSQNYTLQGPVRVSFKHDGALRPGTFEVRSHTDKGQPRESSAASAPSASASVAPAAPAAASPVASGAAGSTLSAVPPRPSATSAPAAVAQATQVVKASTQPVLEIGTRRYGLNDTPIVLGRSSSSDILVDDSGVSRKHLQIDLDGERAWVTDLGSTNGSFVNGERLAPRAELFEGSTITMGNTRMVFRRLPSKDSRV